MKVMVTGGLGFIGLHIIDMLVKEGHTTIILDKETSFNHVDYRGLITYYQADINDSMVEEIFAQELPDIIIHLAAQISVSHSIKDPIYDMRTNGYGTVKLLQYAAKYQLKKFIFASSAAVYGIPDYIPIDEHHPVQPISFYGLSKAVGEQYIKLYKEIFNLDYCILRFANVYGPGQSIEGEAGVISVFIDKIRKNLPLIIYGNGKQTRDFIYVKDVAKACIQAMNVSGSHILNISSDSKLPLNDLVQLLMKQSGSAIATSYKPKKSGDILHSRLKNALARHILNWKPQYTIDTGLKITFNSMIASTKQ